MSLLHSLVTAEACDGVNPMNLLAEKAFNGERGRLRHFHHVTDEFDRGNFQESVFAELTSTSGSLASSPRHAHDHLAEPSLEGRSSFGEFGMMDEPHLTHHHSHHSHHAMDQMAVKFIEEITNPGVMRERMRHRQPSERQEIFEEVWAQSASDSWLRDFAEESAHHVGTGGLEEAVEAFLDQNYPKPEFFEWKSPSALLRQQRLEEQESASGEEEDGQAPTTTARRRLTAVLSHLRGIDSDPTENL